MRYHSLVTYNCPALSFLPPRLTLSYLWFFLSRGLLGDIITMTLVEADIEKGLDVTVTPEGDDRGGRELLWSDQVLWDAVARNNLSSEVHLAACVLCVWLAGSA
jgi:hypothetical protein